MVLLVSWLVTGFASLLDTQLCRRSAPGKTLLPSPYRLLESDLEAAWIGRAIQDRVGRKQCGTAAPVRSDAQSVAEAWWGNFRQWL